MERQFTKQQQYIIIKLMEGAFLIKQTRRENGHTCSYYRLKGNFKTVNVKAKTIDILIERGWMKSDLNKNEFELTEIGKDLYEKIDTKNSIKDNKILFS